jgi:hypothetical protein
MQQVELLNSGHCTALTMLGLAESSVPLDDDMAITHKLNCYMKHSRGPHYSSIQRKAASDFAPMLSSNQSLGATMLIAARLSIWGNLLLCQVEEE